MMEIKTRNDFGKLVEQFRKTGVGAEIGVEYGSFSKQILSQWGGKLISVDMWADSKIEAHARKVLNTERSILIKDSSVHAATEIAEGSLDFVYIDADHDYLSCRQDIYSWFRKVRHGGIVAGHDYLNWYREQGGGCDFGVKAAVDEFCTKFGYTLHVTSEDFWEGNPYPTWYFVKEIPKVIFYTWVNPDPLPDRFKKYIDGWRVLMPEYQVRQISLENIIRTRFVDEAIRRKKYSVAGHYGRCQELYNNGGIYFDIDIEAVRKFDDLLGIPFFVGCETPYRVNNAVIGSVPWHPFIKECLEFMIGFDFDNPGKLGIEIETGPEMFTRIAKKHGWKEENRTQMLGDLSGIVFGSKQFYPYYFDQKYNPGCTSYETYAVHHWAKTW